MKFVSSLQKQKNLLFLSLNDSQTGDDDGGLASRRHHRSLQNQPQLFAELVRQLLHLAEIRHNRLQRDHVLDDKIHVHFEHLHTVVD